MLTHEASATADSIVRAENTPELGEIEVAPFGIVSDGEGNRNEQPVLPMTFRILGSPPARRSRIESFMPRRWKLTAITISIVTSSLTLLTACGGLPATAGILGSLSGLMLVLLIAAFAAGQSGCSDPEPCLSFIDSGPRDRGVDAGSLDADVQDAGEDEAGVMDVCLSDISMAPDRQSTKYGMPELEYVVSLDRDRRAVIDRLEQEGVLASDVARDLAADSDEDREA